MSAPSRSISSESSRRHLVLVVDNTRPADEEPPEPDRQPGASWVHAGWTPRRGSTRPVAARRALLSDDRGAVTAEYVLVVMAAVAFAGVLVAIMRSGEIRQMLIDLVQNALGSAG